jgi:hypothetical protein
MIQPADAPDSPWQVQKTAFPVALESSLDITSGITGVHRTDWPTPQAKLSPTNKSLNDSSGSFVTLLAPLATTTPCDGIIGKGASPKFLLYRITAILACITAITNKHNSVKKKR